MRLPWPGKSLARAVPADGVQLRYFVVEFFEQRANQGRSSGTVLGFSLVELVGVNDGLAVGAQVGVEVGVDFACDEVASPEILKVPTDFICRLAPQMSGTLKGDKAHPGIAPRC